MSLPLDRSTIEKLVRESLGRQLNEGVGRELASTGGSGASNVQAPAELVVNSSARHMHISQEGLELLFGPGYQLEVFKWLYQEGQFASTATVTLVGPRKRIIPNLRILGPVRNLTQIELAYTDSLQLGIDIPTRMSGDIEGTPGGYVMGPKGMLEMKNGIIRAARHVHMSPADAAYYGVKHKDNMKLRIESPYCTTTLEDMLVRVDDTFKLEVHIDTDEANCCDLKNATKMELIR